MLFTWKALGHFIGCVFLGHLFDKIHHDLLMGCAILMAGICSILIPWFHSLIPISILFGIQGIPVGIVSVGKFTYIRSWHIHCWCCLGEGLLHAKYSFCGLIRKCPFNTVGGWKQFVVYSKQNTATLCTCNKFPLQVHRYPLPQLIF